MDRPARRGWGFGWLRLLLTGFVIDRRPPVFILSSHRTVLADFDQQYPCQIQGNGFPNIT
jgi:hypothetical protein